MMQAVLRLPAKQVLADLDAAADYIKSQPAANGKVAVAGFCWGGRKSFDFATHRKDLGAALCVLRNSAEAASNDKHRLSGLRFLRRERRAHHRHC